MMNLYQDESGCLGFKSGSSKYFVVVVLCSDESKRISNVVRKFKGQLIRAGWPVAVEIKAHNLYMSPHNEDIPDTYRYKTDPVTPIETILRRLSACRIEIDAIVVKKAGVHMNLRQLPNSILLNYFSGKVLIDRIVRYDDVNLFVDATNKQSHDSQHFDGYIKTCAYLTKKSFFPLSIEHVDSNVVRGVSAVDFFSWSVFRQYEYGDSRFIDVFRGKISTLKTYYFRRK